MNFKTGVKEQYIQDTYRFNPDDVISYYRTLNSYAKRHNIDYNVQYVGDGDPEVEAKILGGLQQEMEETSNVFSDSVVQATIFKLSAIRLVSNDDETKKCNCAAELLINDRVFDVEYSAQFTEDDQLYVELFF